MHVKNEKVDQALCLTRKHPFGDEQDVTKVLMPGQTYECASIYQVSVSYRDLTDEEKATIAAELAGSAPPPTSPPTLSTEAVDSLNQQLAQGLNPVPVAPDQPIDHAAERALPIREPLSTTGTLAEGAASEQVTEIPAAGSSAVADAGAAGGDVSAVDTMIAEGSPVAAEAPQPTENANLLDQVAGDGVREPPPVDNDHVADGAERFDEPPTDDAAPVVEEVETPELSPVPA